jgi:hypothetical protein
VAPLPCRTACSSRAGKAKVDRHEDRAKSEGGEHGDKKCGAVELEIGHPNPAGYAAGGEHRGEASGSIVQFRVREIATRVSEYDNVGPIACIYVECPNDGRRSSPMAVFAAPSAGVVTPTPAGP